MQTARSIAPSTGRARVGTYTDKSGATRDVELAYDVFGERGRPLVLVMGIGCQRVFWDDQLCEQFVAAGFHVIRFDHRDVGESTRLEMRVPKPWPAFARRMLGARVDAPYSLSHMASDVVGLLDAVGWRDAHVAGVSMGGMIVQHLAIEHPSRIRSVTSIMSSPGARRYVPQPQAFGALFSPPPRDQVAAGRHTEKMFTILGTPTFPADPARLRAHGEAAFARGLSPRGFLRHFVAALASADRSAQLPRVTAPTLVIHGSQDPMFPLAAGRRTAALVPGATWLPITGMGHSLPEPLWRTLVGAIARHAERADVASKRT
jgi:pimeloyl-ACP methyl ester carboxylesterase